jgi:hypothetical protein
MILIQIKTSEYWAYRLLPIYFIIVIIIIIWGIALRLHESGVWLQLHKRNGLILSHFFWHYCKGSVNCLYEQEH